MDKTELLLYEMPTWYEFVPFDFLQDILARRLYKKVARKLRRYESKKQLIGRFYE